MSLRGLHLHTLENKIFEARWDPHKVDRRSRMATMSGSSDPFKLDYALRYAARWAPDI